MQIRARKRMDHMMGYALSDDPEVTRDLSKFGLGTERTLDEFSKFCGVDFKARIVTEYALRASYVKDLYKYKDKKIFIPEVDTPEEYDAENNPTLTVLALPDPAQSSSQPYDIMMLANNAKRRLHADKSVPEGMLVIHNFIERSLCDSFLNYAQEQAYKEQPTGERAEIDGMASEVLGLFNDIFCHRLAPFYKTAFEWYERPHFVRYPEGSRYSHRTDASQYDALTKKWIRAADRDYSVSLTISDYEGGDLHFTERNYRIKPRVGTLMAFPSDHRFIYTTMPIITGNRYDMASWGASLGSPRVRALAPYASVFLRQKRPS
jgi:hypothetical protein